MTQALSGQRDITKLGILKTTHRKTKMKRIWTKRHSERSPIHGAPPYYISRRPSIAFHIVTSSANSMSLPTGMPMAMRVTFTPSGFSSFDR